VTVYDVAGNHVETLEMQNIAAGNAMARWKLQNSAGRQVANGTYFFRINADLGNTKIKKSGKISVLK
jgi:flagellar hook assembly protein FlgD